ncbi:hypothetical protein [Holdemania sp. Marseille-P2844]|nr:hypothetical protein [Holdemania sp. Marseille-P2844]
MSKITKDAAFSVLPLAKMQKSKHTLRSAAAAQSSVFFLFVRC